MRKDAISEFEKAGRNDLIEAYNNEISILNFTTSFVFINHHLKRMIAHICSARKQRAVAALNHRADVLCFFFFPFWIFSMCSFPALDQFFCAGRNKI